MTEQRMPNCRDLTWKAKNQESLSSLQRDSELWKFAESWLSRFLDTREDNPSEKFIYLWVTVNAWLSQVVPNLSENYNESYLTHSMAIEPRFQFRFDELLKNAARFNDNVQEITELAPVFQVLWMRNNRIEPWDNQQDRKDFIAKTRLRNPVNPTKQGPRPAFAPSCALEHLDKGEKIPSDWVHVAHIIYQIRCNLFHGGKSYDSSRDRRFVELAYQILWKVWSPEIPDYIKSRIPKVGIEWRRVLIRSGFLFKESDSSFDFSEEDRANLGFLQSILKEIGFEKHLDNDVFTPPSKTVDESLWLDAVEKLHRGTEGERFSWHEIRLEIMDTYVAGIVRWVNLVGLETGNSCDGHGKNIPSLTLINRNQIEALNTCLRAISHGRWNCDRSGRLIENSRIPPRPVSRQDSYDRYWLLDIAEKLYKNKEDLQKLVGVIERINIAER